jgi:aldose 1-epimerase
MIGKTFLAIVALGLAGSAQAAGVEMRTYGTTSDGETVREFALQGDDGMVVRFLSYGGIITAIEVPDHAGHVDNVVLGLPDLATYETRNSSYFFGGIVGRYAGRIANARFPLDGSEVRLVANDGPNALHGGAGEAFIAKVWQVEPLTEPGSAGAVLTYASPAGEQGFPGRLEVKVTYRLLPGRQLRIDYEARTDAPTVLNLTNHSYFNLSGAAAGPVFNQRLQVFAHRIVAATEAGIPTGEFLPVADTAFDFLAPRAVGDCLEGAMPRIGGFCGYNHSWLVEGAGADEPVLAARLTDPHSGRRLEVLTTEPTVHIYIANHFSGEDMGAAGVLLQPHHGIAMETQHLPDSPNRPEFPTTLLRPGETFRSTTIYRFGVEGG